MTGSIPDLFYNLNHLVSFEIENNLLTGSLPSSIANLASLTELFVQNNSLSGHLFNVFNGSHQSKLTSVQLSNNQFTGELPEQLFFSSSLVTFSAVSNCFHGTIPSSICLNKKLETLALDGLVCASSCQTKILPGISSSYISTRKISGGIPHCLFGLLKLQVLHLSGNSLSGNLPKINDVMISSLNDLSISYNYFTGTISSNIQHKSWPKLDLSHNLFTGTLRTMYSKTAEERSLFMTNNRFSGFIPTIFLNMIKIDILEGNLFTCNNDNSNLPSHDHYVSVYDCGSNVFNILYYIWLGLIMAIIISGLWVWYARKDIIFLVHQWITAPLSLSTVDNIEINESLKEKLTSMVFLKRYIKTLEIIRNISLYSIIFIIIVLLPTYTILSTLYSTHTYSYAWTVALMYLSGKVAFGISMGVLMMFIAIQILAVVNSFTSSPNQIIFNDYVFVTNSERRINQWKLWSMFTFYITVNFMIVGGANVAYVLVELYESRSISLLSQILISIFKLMWNNMVSPAMVREMVRILCIKGIAQQSTWFFLQFVISIFNNIIIPCVVVIIISPNCFYNVFHQESDVTSTYSFTSCSSYYRNGSCETNYNVSSTTSYSPPFIYSYQCSSAFIKSYSPVFVVVCILSTFVFPLTQVLWIRFKLPNILLFSRIFYPFDESEVTALIYIDQVYKGLVSELTLVGLLMTFGAIFPPLAVAFFLNICVSSYYHQAVFGRFIMTIISCKRYSHLDILEDNLNVQPLLSTIQKCGWFLLYVSYSFYTLFLYDILGDSVGFDKAYWVLIVMPCIPLCIHASYLLMEWMIASRRRDSQSSHIIDTQIQMNPLVRLDSAKIGRDSSIRDLSIEDRYSQPLKE